MALLHSDRGLIWEAARLAQRFARRIVIRVGLKPVCGNLRLTFLPVEETASYIRGFI